MQRKILPHSVVHGFEVEGEKGRKELVGRGELVVQDHHALQRRGSHNRRKVQHVQLVMQTRVGWAQTRQRFAGGREKRVRERTREGRKEYRSGEREHLAITPPRTPSPLLLSNLPLFQLFRHPCELRTWKKASLSEGPSGRSHKMSPDWCEAVTLLLLLLIAAAEAEEEAEAGAGPSPPEPEQEPEGLLASAPVPPCTAACTFSAICVSDVAPAHTACV